MEGDLVFFVNGKKMRPAKSAWEVRLVHYLRGTLKLTGTKAACGSGYCGACTVMVSTFDDKNSCISHAAMNACLLPLFCLHGKAVTTVEAIGSANTSLHPVQSRLVESHGSQCGYCTPGMVMSMYALLRSNPKPSITQMEHAIQGNMCRCTGYRPIVDGFKTFCQVCPMESVCCKTRDESGTINSESKYTDIVNSYEPSQEVIFPNELQVDSDQYKDTILTTDGLRYYQPQQLIDLLKLINKLPDPTLVYGYTHGGIPKKQPGGATSQRNVISCVNVWQLHGYSMNEAGITVGAAVSISRLEMILSEAIEMYQDEAALYTDNFRHMFHVCGLKAFCTRVTGCDIYTALLELIPTLGGKQYRNMLAIGDHIANWSASATLLPVLICAGCDVTFANIGCDQQTIKLRDAEMDKGLQLKCNDVVVDLKIPKSMMGMFVKGYTVRPRHAAPASVVAGLQVSIAPNTQTVTDACLVFGGISDHMVSASQTACNLLTKEFTESLYNEVLQILNEELLGPSMDDSLQQRLRLVAACFYKFFCFVRNYKHALPDTFDSIQHMYGTQVYELSGESEISALGQPLPLYTAPQLATGEAEYVDDMPQVAGELTLVLVWSKVANARITRVDASQALIMPGVVDFISSKDVPGKNKYGPITEQDEEIFATAEVSHVGAVIGAILADTAQHAHDAAQAVLVQYHAMPHILTISEAIEAESFYDVDRFLCDGDPDAGFEVADFIVEDCVESGGQLHVPLEKGACIVLPKKGEQELEVWVTSQNQTVMQRMVSDAVNLPSHRVHMRVKRLGGGFGGKDITPRRYCLPTAVAAFKHKRPVRCSLTREEDAMFMSTRHPMLAKYKVGYMDDGTIVALDVDVYLNGGSSTDISVAVLDSALMQITGGYKLPNIRVRGRLCRTNLLSPTAFRGFGRPQGQFVTSTAVRHVARLTGVPVEHVQEKHLLREGDFTHLGDHLVDFNLPKCWNQLVVRARHAERLSAIEAFNRQHDSKKRGIALQPVVMGLEFEIAYLNQGGSLVNIYVDGSVLISHGGVEMGQGIHTKLMQVASRTLGVPLSRIHISETSSAAVPNPSSTSASMGSDIYGMAVHNACKRLNERLAPVKAAKPDGSWEEWVMAAYMDRVCLSATGFHDFPGKVDFDYNKQFRKFPVFGYYTTGAACTEVEVDLLTGSLVVLRTDIVMDVGQSLNPAIDVGQIEGGFVQGAGMYTTEEVRWREDGTLLTNNFSNYFIPTIEDTPREFNVTLLKESVNPRAVYSSKGIGEPPLLASSSVLFAVQEALYAALDQRGQRSVAFILNSPATSDKIHRLCMEYGLSL